MGTEEDEYDGKKLAKKDKEFRKIYNFFRRKVNELNLPDIGYSAFDNGPYEGNSADDSQLFSFLALWKQYSLTGCSLLFSFSWPLYREDIFSDLDFDYKKLPSLDRLLLDNLNFGYVSEKDLWSLEIWPLDYGTGEYEWDINFNLHFFGNRIEELEVEGSGERTSERFSKYVPQLLSAKKGDNIMPFLEMALDIYAPDGKTARKEYGSDGRVVEMNVVDPR